MFFESSPSTAADNSWHDVLIYLDRKKIPYSYFDIAQKKGIKVETSVYDFIPFMNPLNRTITPIDTKGVVIPTKDGWVSFFLYHYYMEDSVPHKV